MQLKIIVDPQFGKVLLNTYWAIYLKELVIDIILMSTIQSIIIVSSCSLEQCFLTYGILLKLLCSIMNTRVVG